MELLFEEGKQTQASMDRLNPFQDVLFGFRNVEERLHPLGKQAREILGLVSEHMHGEDSNLFVFTSKFI